MSTARTLVGLVLLPWIVGVAMAAPTYDSTAIQAVPPNISAQGAKPMMTMVSSKDHTLFSPIYTDFEDLDGDGVIDVTFKPDFTYYGYFDSTKCYAYSTTNSRFEPAGAATVTSDLRSTCSSDESWWNGNFLNWATMTRLDVIRKMLYGGKRSTDSDTVTVLERANLSKDSHSFVKYYRGTDIRDYTPFTTAALTKTTGSNANVYAGLSICSRSYTDSQTMGEAGTPLIKLAKGNYRLWATVEGTVCQWGSGTLGAKLARYYKDSDKGAGGIAHESSPPSSSTDGATYDGIGPELTMRVKVCSSSLLETNCHAYGTEPSVVYKPRGLFQEFGMAAASAAAARVEFALITGSYDKNLTAGALRRNMGDLEDEVRASTGRFCHISGSGCPATLPDGRATGAGAVKALDNIVLYGRGSGNYAGSNVQLPSQMTNGTLPAWGNPIGEMVIQALQYYSGQSDIQPSSTTNDAAKGLPVVDEDDLMDPLSTENTTRTSLYGNPICRSLNVLALSSSALSFDGDDADAPFTTLPNRSLGSLSAFTDKIGTEEGVDGTLRSVGSVTGGFGEHCSAKTISGLSNVSGICPEAPGIGGTFKVAGAAYYANTNRVRDIADDDLPPDFDKVKSTALKVKTYAASLTGGVARIEVPIPGTSPTKYVYITPESLWAASSNTKKMPGAMLTFASISSSSTHGAFIVTWNDSLFGGDYDMDIAGFLRYDVVENAATPSGWDIKITTDIINVGAGWTGTHGFSIIGTNADGRYLTHRHLTSDSVLDGATGHLCDNSSYSSANPNACNVSTSWNTIANKDSPIAFTFQMNAGGAEEVTLKEPLWYAAKYGAFTSSDESTDLPDTDNKWDARRNDGEACDVDPVTFVKTCDGEPDGYFLARRPDLLEKQLRDTFEQIVATSNAAPAISSAQLITGSYKYIAQFEPSQNSGSVLAYQLDENGDFPEDATWDAGKGLAEANWETRDVITNDGIAGTPFATDTDFSADYVDALKGTDSAALTDEQMDELINFMRGERENESPAGIWRSRSVSNILGTIVNASPWLQTRPAARFLASMLPTGTPSYSDFALARADRNKVLWVGSNDGMLHAFHADGAQGGKPIISYVPSPLVGRLKTIAQNSGSIIAGMDGSPYTGDVLIAGTSSKVWKTYLFSSLGRGGRAVFALDVTDTSTTALSEGNAASIFKWMFTSGDDSDLGYVLGDHVVHPTSGQAVPIMRLNNGQFGILVPNGVNSTSGKAFLFIVAADGPSSTGVWTTTPDADTGYFGYAKLPTDATTGNGMVGANWVDLDNNGSADVVYGTDLRGRVWKFDISSADASQWKSALVNSSDAPVPFFEAKDGTDELPISTAPAVSFPPFGGVMVSFGTGKSIVTGDFPDTSKPQRFYSLWDDGQTTGPVAPSDLSTLVERELTRQSDGSIYVSGSDAAIDWTEKDGWYFDFPGGSSGTSEMLLSMPEYRAESLAFTTVRPPVTTDPAPCYDTPNGSLYIVDPASGLPKTSAIGTTTITNSDGTTTTVYKMGMDSDDQKVRYAIDTSARITDPDEDEGATCPAGYSSLRVVGKNSDFNLCFSQGTARIQWREVPGLRTD